MGGVERKSKEILQREPTLEIPSEFMQQVLTEADKYQDLETGGKIFGVEYEVSGIRHLTPLLSFTPIDEDEIVRRENLVDIGGLSCVLYEKWAWVYWENIANTIPDQKIKETELKLLGTWHLQPKGSAHYSKTDAVTAGKFFGENPDRDNLLFIILSEDDPKEDKDYRASFIYGKDNKKYEINYYHVFKDDGEIRNLVPVSDSRIFTRFPETPWFAKNPKLYNFVIEDIQGSGFEVNPEFRINENAIEPELCLTTQSQASCRSVYIRIPNDFDESQMIYFRDKGFKEKYASEMQIFLKDYDWSKISYALNYYLAFNT